MIKKVIAKFWLRITNKWVISVSCFLLAILLTGFNYHVEHYTNPLISKKVTDLNHAKVGLVLGTSKYTKTNTINLFYKYRIDAAFQLYQSGKVDYLLISGDNGTKEYNEPKKMKADLIKKGIPENKIYLDYAGFRTLDSVIRLKKVFGVTDVIIVSQTFHLQRALYLCKWQDIKGQGYATKDLKGEQYELVMLREKLARVKLLIDCVVGTEPKFLGKEEDYFK